MVTFDSGYMCYIFSYEIEWIFPSHSKVSNLVFEEFNGIPGKNAFYASPKLTQRIATELNAPLTFQYVKGRIVDIQAATGVSDTIVNIVRGILGFLQVTVKTTQKVYELEEVLCHFNFNIKYDVHFVKNVNHHVLG